MALRAGEAGRPLFVLWLDAHPDLHTLDTTWSGNLHGIPAAYFMGLPGFDALPHPAARVPPAQVCMMGLRSIDTAEEAQLAQLGVRLHRMPDLHRDGVESALGQFLDTVAEAHGHLHVSLDVDFLDPSVAPAVGTAVPDGASAGQARAIASLLGDSGLVTSLDLVELNPTLDVNGMSAALLAELAVGMLTERRLDRETESKTGT
jgi:arginase